MLSTTFTSRVSETSEPSVAITVIVTVPAFRPFTRPAETVATVSSALLHTSAGKVASAGAVSARTTIVFPTSTSAFSVSGMRVMSVTLTTVCEASTPSKQNTLLPGRVTLRVASMSMAVPSSSPGRASCSPNDLRRMILPLTLAGMLRASRRVKLYVLPALPPLRRVSVDFLPFQAAQP